MAVRHRRDAARRAPRPRRGSSGGAAAPLEGGEVEIDRDAVQLDRPLDRLRRYRHQPLLVGMAEHEQVGRDRIAEQPGREPGRVDELGAALADRGGDIARAGRGSGTARSGLRVKSPVMISWLLTTARVVPACSLRQRLGAGRHDEVAAEQQARAAGGDAHGVDRLRARRRCAHGSAPRRLSAPCRAGRARRRPCLRDAPPCRATRRSSRPRCRRRR